MDVPLSQAPPKGATTLLPLASAPDPLFKASKAPFLTLRIATLSGAPREALLERNHVVQDARIGDFLRVLQQYGPQLLVAPQSSSLTDDIGVRLSMENFEEIRKGDVEILMWPRFH